MGAAGLLILIRVMTFNIWGLPDAGFQVLSPLREERVAALCARLKSLSSDADGPDVVLLQETWVAKDRKTLSNCGYAYQADKDDARRLIDSGLMVLSRYPLDEVSRLTFVSQPDPSSALDNGEAFARKSALLVRVNHPRAGHVWVANTHLVSIYSDEHDDLLPLRRRQLKEMIAWATQKASNEPLILGGDFNFKTGSPLWKELPQLLTGYTYPSKTLTTCTLCKSNFMHDEDEGRVDYLFGSPALTVASGEVMLQEPVQIGDDSVNYSDHFAWEVGFQLPALN